MPWICIHTEKAKESVANQALEAAGFPTLFLHTRRRRWRHGRRVIVKAPLFPSYLFCECMNGVRPVLDCRGVAAVIGGFQPIAVPPEVIMELRSRGDESGLVTTPPLKVGDVRRIGRVSPLAGLLATIASLPDPHGKLRAWVKLLGGETLVTLQLEDLDEA